MHVVERTGGGRKKKREKTTEGVFVQEGKKKKKRGHSNFRIGTGGERGVFKRSHPTYVLRDQFLERERRGGVYP